MNAIKKFRAVSLLYVLLLAVSIPLFSAQPSAQLCTSVGKSVGTHSSPSANR